METLESILDRLKSVWKIIKPKLDLLFFMLISASWFPQLPNKKVMKWEYFYVWMSIAGFFGAYGLGRDVENNVEFSTQYYLFISMFIIGWVLKAGTVFGYKAGRSVQEYFWETQLMRFMDPKHSKQFLNYPNRIDRLRVLKLMWFNKHDVTVEWTRANAPFILKIQIALLIGLTGLGLFLGLHL